MLILTFGIFGLVGIALAFVAVRANRRYARDASMGAGWLRTYRWSWLVGAVLGAGSGFIGYPLRDHGETWRVLGFPFFAAAFGPGGTDYVGVTTVPALLGNVLFFAATPQLVLWAWGRWGRPG